MEVNPLKIGPFLLCYHDEDPFFVDSTYWKLHNDLKNKYNFFITNTSINIVQSTFLQQNLKPFVTNYENHCYLLSNKSIKYFYEDITAISKEFLSQQKSLSHLAVIMVDDLHIDKTKLNENIELFNFATNEYESEFENIARYFISVIDDPIIRFDLQRFFGSQSIIKVCGSIDANLIMKFSNNPNELLTINRNLFEELIAEIFYGFGYTVELTKKTRDGGRDIVAIKQHEVLVKYLIECKRPDIGHKIGVRPVRELFAVKTDELATKAILATTATFTKDARLFLERHKWEMEGKDFSDLMSWIQEYRKLKNI
jgi:hypothetical protein